MLLLSTLMLSACLTTSPIISEPLKLCTFTDSELVIGNIGTANFMIKDYSPDDVKLKLPPSFKAAYSCSITMNGTRMMVAEKGDNPSNVSRVAIDWNGDEKIDESEIAVYSGPGFHSGGTNFKFPGPCKAPNGVVYAGAEVGDNHESLRLFLYGAQRAIVDLDGYKLRLDIYDTSLTGDLYAGKLENEKRVYISIIDSDGKAKYWMNGFSTCPYLLPNNRFYVINTTFDSRFVTLDPDTSWMKKLRWPGALYVCWTDAFGNRDILVKNPRLTIPKLETKPGEITISAILKNGRNDLYYGTYQFDHNRLGLLLGDMDLLGKSGNELSVTMAKAEDQSYNVEITNRLDSKMILKRLYRYSESSGVGAPVDFEVIVYGPQGGVVDSWTQPAGIYRWTPKKPLEKGKYQVQIALKSGVTDDLYISTDLKVD